MEEVEGRYSAADIAAVGIANQRETTLVWDKCTGKPLYNALVWLDTRTAGIVAQLAKESDAGKDRFRDICGLPLAQCYCAMKLRWLPDNVPAVKSAACAGTALFGTVESWLIYNLSGGAMNDGIHVTDVSNACQTMLMDLSTCTWHGATLEALDIPRSMLPRIVSNSEVYCKIKSGVLEGVPIAGALGDQQAAVLGQQCFNPGQAKNTFGTSSCLLMPIGSQPIVSKSGLLTKVGFQLGPHAPVTYCFEGAAPVAGAGVSWLRDNLKVIDSARAIGGCGTGNGLVDSVDSTHGLHFVPAFTGLFTPHYCDDARGMIIGLTQYHSKAHIALAMLEAICFQCKEILDAMQDDSGVSLKQLRVDGGMVVRRLLTPKL